MRWPVVLAMSGLMLASAETRAQERGIEVQAGAGYVFDTGEGPSVPTATVGAIGWITRGWGFGARLSKGLRDDPYDPPIEIGDGFALGPGDLRIWSLTSQWRWFAGGTEVNFGFGAGGHGYRYKRIQQGIERAGSRSGSGFVAFELFAGRHLRGPLYVKGGFTYGLAGDLHPFQPIVMLVFKP